MAGREERTMQATLNNFVDKLCRTPILDALQREEAMRLSHMAGSPRELAQELLRRDWLTPYQANQIAQGKGDDLVLGQYVILERLGEGGMGQVFKARQRNLDRIVALKLIRPECLDNERVINRFQREIRAAGQLSHPNIVRAYDADQIKGHWFIAMEYIEGSDLAREVKNQGPLPLAAACDYVRQAALGLQHAHERGMVHRDIKPANLLVTRVAEKPRISGPLTPRPPLGRERTPIPAKETPFPWGMIKILDLGLARLGESLTGSMANLTQLNTVMGTPDFISPEQALSSKSCDIRSDLYSLGCTFYFMLAGQAPFPEGTLTQKLLQHQGEEPQSVAFVRAAKLATSTRPAADDDGVPREVEAVLRKLMAKKPDQRFQTPGQVAIVLEGIVEGLQSGASRREALPHSAVPTSSPPASPPRSTPPLAAPVDPIEVEMRSASGILPPQPVPAAPIPVAKPVRARKRPALRTRAFRMRAFLIGGVAATLLVAFLVARGGRQAPSDPAGADLWRTVAAKVKNKLGTPEELVQELAKFRTSIPFGPHAVEAGQLLATLPSPLDSFDRAKIDPKTAFAKMPPEIVGIFGNARGVALGRSPTMALSGDGGLLAVLSDEGPAMRFFNLRTHEPPSRTVVASGRTYRIAFLGDGTAFATMADDGVKLWDAKNRTPMLALEAGSKAAFSGAYGPEGKTFAAAGADGIVRVWDLPNAKPRTTLQTNTGKVLSLAWAPDGKTLVWGGDNHEIHWADPAHASAEGSYVGCQGPVRILAFHPDGHWLVCGSSKKGALKVCTWDGKKLRDKQTLAEHSNVVQDLSFSADGTLFATAGEDATVKIWDCATLTVKHSFDMRWPVHAVAFAPDSRHVVAGAANGTFCVFRLKS